jgi:hypothetical protein
MNVGDSALEILIYNADNETISTSYTKAITIENNVPTLTSIEINGKTEGEQIEITQGNWIEITFQANDHENGIMYAKIDLVYDNPDTGLPENFSYIVDYEGQDTTLRIRSVDLPVGTFAVYAYVIDEDGATSQGWESYSFELKPQDQTTPMMWLMGIVGLIIGASLSIGILHTSMKRRAERKALLKFEKISEAEESKVTASDKSAEQSSSKSKKSEETKSKNKKNVTRRL